MTWNYTVAYCAAKGINTRILYVYSRVMTQYSFDKLSKCNEQTFQAAEAASEI